MRGGFALAGLIVLASCGSKSPEELADGDVPGRDVSPDGVAYPTDHLGSHPRVGTRPGDRIPNFTFLGYVDGDRSKGLQPISLADYFDPDQKRHKLLHLQGAATWCSICASETQATRRVKDDMAAEGVVYLQVIVSGPTSGFGPAQSEVDQWMTTHGSNYSTAVDVRARRLSALGINGQVMPWDVLVDTRTMEILDSSGGAPSDIVKYDRQGLALVKGPKAY